MMRPADPIETLFTRLSPLQKRALRKLGIATIRDLLYHLPARYEDARRAAQAGSITPGAEVALVGTIRKPEARKTWKSRRPVAEAWLEDASGRIKLMWFSQPYIAKTLHDGMVVKVSGRVAGSAEKPYLANPRIEKSAAPMGAAPGSLFRAPDSSPPDPLSASLFPLYPESQGISSLWLYHAIQRAAPVIKRLEDPLPSALLARYSLPTLSTALIWAHRPRTLDDAQKARKRFAFEEVFLLQLALERERVRAKRERAFPVAVDQKALAHFVASFPFPATAAQKRAIDAIVRDFTQAHPMLRLLEGDVGSGKTAVAAASAYLVATSHPPEVRTSDVRTSGGKYMHVRGGNLQVAYLCPTEILAKQHFSTFISYFHDHPIPIGLITGNECRVFPSRVRYEESAKLSRAAFRKRVAGGEIPIVIGTHALIEKTLEFKHLAYAIIDEQHRFGVMHRAKLTRKPSAAPPETTMIYHSGSPEARSVAEDTMIYHSSSAKAGGAKRNAMRYHSGTTPHLLSMTATPIPRTLALTIYGDLDLTLLDQMPGGRKPIVTEVLGPEERERAYARVRAELAAGRQAFVICPRIDEPDPEKLFALQAKSVKAEAARLAKDVFPGISIDILHSKLKPAEKETVMKEFAAGETGILVATSVVEVGVNVPNATVILIEGAERFGLSQLHQLRGRVIRSEHQAYCFALPESWGANTRERMKAFKNAKDGFALAEYDLAIRGAGELSGGKQWGVSDIAMEALRNRNLVEAARAEAARLVKEDPELAAHPALRAQSAAALASIHLE